MTNLTLIVRLIAGRTLQRLADAVKPNLTAVFPEDGRYHIGPFDVTRFTRSGGYDTGKFFKDNPEIAAQAFVEGYARPAVAVARVSLHDPRKVSQEA